MTSTSGTRPAYWPGVRLWYRRLQFPTQPVCCFFLFSLALSRRSREIFRPAPAPRVSIFDLKLKTKLWPAYVFSVAEKRFTGGLRSTERIILQHCSPGDRPRREQFHSFLQPRRALRAAKTTPIAIHLLLAHIDSQQNGQSKAALVNLILCRARARFLEERMQYVRSISGSVSKTWNSINPATLSGAIDVIVVQLEDGKQASKTGFSLFFGSGPVSQ